MVDRLDPLGAEMRQFRGPRGRGDHSRACHPGRLQRGAGHAASGPLNQHHMPRTGGHPAKDHPPRRQIGHAKTGGLQGVGLR